MFEKGGRLTPRRRETEWRFQQPSKFGRKRSSKSEKHARRCCQKTIGLEGGKRAVTVAISPEGSSASRSSFSWKGSLLYFGRSLCPFPCRGRDLPIRRKKKEIRLPPQKQGVCGIWTLTKNPLCIFQEASSEQNVINGKEDGL